MFIWLQQLFRLPILHPCLFLSSGPIRRNSSKSADKEELWRLMEWVTFVISVKLFVSWLGDKNFKAYKHAHIQAHKHTHTPTCAHIHAHTYTHTRAHMQSLIRVHTCTHTYTHKQTPTHTESHAHTYTPTQTHTLLGTFSLVWISNLSWIVWTGCCHSFLTVRH